MTQGPHAESNPKALAHKGLTEQFIAIACAGVLLALAWVDPWPGFATLLAILGVTLGSFRPRLSAAILVAAYPMLDFTPWAGQWALRHHDFLTLGICSGWWHYRAVNQHEFISTSKLLDWPMAYSVWVAVSALMGAFFISEYAHPEAVVFFSPSNAFRTAKGAWLAILIVKSFPSGQQTSSGVPDLLCCMARGAPWALVYIGVWCLLERATFVGWTDWSTPFRVAGPMSGAMNVGGQALSGVILAMLPLSICGWSGSPWSRWAIVVGIAMGVTALLLTLTRSAVGTVVVMALFWCIFSLRKKGWPWARRDFLVFALALVVPAVAVLLVPAFRSRFSHVSGAASERIKGAEYAVGMVGDRPHRWIVGVGMGSFPTLFEHSVKPTGKAGAFAAGEGNDYGSLTAFGRDSGYLGRQLQSSLGTADGIRILVKSNRDSDLTIYLCEKNLLESFACRIADFHVPASQDWLHIEAPVLGDPLDQSGALGITRPLNLSFGTPSDAAVMQLRSIELVTLGGDRLWKEDDLSSVREGWLMTTDRYEPFHIESNLAYLLVEQGAIGLLLMIALVGLAAYRAHRIRDRAGLPLLMLIIAGVVYGLVNSTLDTPESATLFLVPVMALANRPMG